MGAFALRKPKRQVNAGAKNAKYKGRAHAIAFIYIPRAFQPHGAAHGAAHLPERKPSIAQQRGNPKQPNQRRHCLPNLQGVHASFRRRRRQAFGNGSIELRDADGNRRFGHRANISRDINKRCAFCCIRHVEQAKVENAQKGAYTHRAEQAEGHHGPKRIGIAFG